MLLNYATHVATVLNVPGDGSVKLGIYKIMSLFLPFIGVARGFRAICFSKRLGETDLHHAARSGAICIVVRDPSTWIADGPQFSPGDYKSPRAPDIRRRKQVSGRCLLPEGYFLARMPGIFCVKD